MNKLEKLAIRYGTDKYGKHHYIPVYYNLFKYRQKSVKKVIEIGAGEGLSLFMWEDFFPNAKIYSGEIDDKRIFKKGRIEVIKCNQANDDDLINLFNVTGSDVDLFIDDGSHKPEDQIFTCKFVVPALDMGAIYVIEDVVDESIFEEIKKRFGYYDCQMMKLGKRYDDRLIIITKTK